jgi:SAM-dependent methyltransferase
MMEIDLEKAAQRGNPSFVWRAGQERRLRMIQDAAGDKLEGAVLVDGCGVGTYLSRLEGQASQAIGLEIEFPRCIQARQTAEQVINGAGEELPFIDCHFDLVLSHEVLEHVQDGQLTIREIVRVLRPGGLLLLFCPNRGYPFETHGIYWRGRYRFGNIPLVNYLPRSLRDRLAPHVDVYTRRDLNRLFEGMPVRFMERTVVFGAYDNIIVRFGALGHLLRGLLQALERTPLRVFGLSHFWVVEKQPE